MKTITEQNLLRDQLELEALQDDKLEFNFQLENLKYEHEKDIEFLENSGEDWNVTVSKFYYDLAVKSIIRKLKLLELDIMNKEKEIKSYAKYL